MNQLRQAEILHNNNLHRIQLDYLDMALAYVQAGQRRDAARLLNQFHAANKQRKLARVHLTPMPSPHQQRQEALHAQLQASINALVEQGDVREVAV